MTTTVPVVSEPLQRALGLTDEEAERIDGILVRPANGLELAMYSVMWSEHCSYKSSRIHLKRLPTEAPWVLVGPGENAGVVDEAGRSLDDSAWEGPIGRWPTRFSLPVLFTPQRWSPPWPLTRFMP